MPLNLITDTWIPVVLNDGSKHVIAPWQIADPAVVALDWPRPDFNIACLELLIGLVFLVDPPEDDEDWEEREAPDAQRLRQRLQTVAHAFNLVGDGPLFLQDLEPLQGQPSPPDMLFIDSAGGATERNNADLMVWRDRYPRLPLTTAAMALYTFQAFAPAGGAGNRTSMRGGGPLVTLVEPGGGLWSLIWANVPCGEPASTDTLPWMRPTRPSVGGTEVWPPTEPPIPIEVFFGMPRRLRLVLDDQGMVTGVIQRPRGNNYRGWLHPLSPYYRLKAGSELLPQHPRPGLFGYRHWLGIVAASRGGEVDGLRQRAAMVRTWHDRSLGRSAQVIVAGWAMSNMKPLDFTWSIAPLIELDNAATQMLSGLIEAAGKFALALRHALAVVLGEGEAREPIREAFFTRTQDAFENRLAALQAGADPAKVAEQWLADTRAVALRLFDEQALPGLPDHIPEQQAAIIRARLGLLASFNGRGKYGKDAWAALEMQPAPKRKVDPTQEIAA